MLKTFFTSVALMLISIGVFSQSLLYKVTGEKTEYPVYIYGTIHALPQDDFFIDAAVIEKFAEAQKLVLEIDMSSPTMALEAQTAMMMKDNSIDKIVTTDEYQRLGKFFADSLQLPIEMLKQVKPLMLSSFLIQKIIGAQSASYELHFMQQAMTQQKPMGGLETIGEQIGYIDLIPLEQQTRMLMESIDDFNQSKIDFQLLVEQYKSRDAEAVYKFMMESDEEFKQFGEFLIDKRNENWIPKIVELGNAQITFVAVGCGHLGGDKGVLNLLRNEGFRVEMVE
ncbi:MAG: TraB/GumN family protein [Tenuifilaceae bacterium]|nr:TraB/GumN family protein [Tenuifilaceae bacterium]